MPNRYLKESICTSGTVTGLSLLGQVLYFRLIVTCDDYGLFIASEPVILGRCFPFDSHHFATIGILAVLGELQDAGVIHLYTDRGRPFGQILNFTIHNPPRSNHPKFPLPEEISEDLEIAIKKRCPGLLTGKTNTNLSAACSQDDRNLSANCSQSVCNLKSIGLKDAHNLKSAPNTNTSSSSSRSFSYSEEIKNTSTIPPTTEPLLSTTPPEPAAQAVGHSPLVAALSLADDMRSELVVVRPKARLASPITWDNVRGAWAQALLPLLERDGLEHGRIMATWRATILDQFELGNMLHPQAPARFAARFDELEAKREREPSARVGGRSSVENLIPGAFSFDLDKYLEEHPENAVEGWPGDGPSKEA